MTVSSGLNPGPDTPAASKYSNRCTAAMLALADSTYSRAAMRCSASLPMYPSMTTISRSRMDSSWSAAMRAASARDTVWSECCSGESLTMYVLPLLRETTRVRTL